MNLQIAHINFHFDSRLSEKIATPLMDQIRRGWDNDAVTNYTVGYEPGWTPNLDLPGLEAGRIHYRQEGGRLFLKSGTLAGVVDHREKTIRFSSQSDIVDDIPFLSLFQVSAAAAIIDGAVLFHSSGACRNDRACLFVGRSGSGKSTIADMLSKEGWRVLCDECNAVSLNAGNVATAYATPFTKPHYVHNVLPARSAVTAIYIIHQGMRDDICRISPVSAVKQLLSHAIGVPIGARYREAIVDIIASLCSSVPVYALMFRRDSRLTEMLDAAVAGGDAP